MFEGFPWWSMPFFVLEGSLAESGRNPKTDDSVELKNPLKIPTVQVWRITQKLAPDLDYAWTKASAISSPF